MLAIESSIFVKTHFVTNILQLGASRLKRKTARKPEIRAKSVQNRRISDKIARVFSITIFQEEAVMAGAAPITLDAYETGILQKILRSHTLGKKLLARTQIVLAASEH